MSSRSRAAARSGTQRIEHAAVTHEVEEQAREPKLCRSREQARAREGAEGAVVAGMQHSVAQDRVRCAAHGTHPIGDAEAARHGVQVPVAARDELRAAVEDEAVHHLAPHAAPGRGLALEDHDVEARALQPERAGEPGDPSRRPSSCAAAAPSPSWRPPRIPRIWSRARPALGHGARALGDRRRASTGAPRFFQAATARGACARWWGRTARSGRPPRRPRPAGCCCWSRSAAGYRNLCRLLTLGHASGLRRRAKRAWPRGRRWRNARGGAPLALAGGEAGPLAGAGAACSARSSPGPASAGDRLAVDVHRARSRAAARRLARRLTAALAEAAHGVPVVASGDVRLAAPDGPRAASTSLTCRAPRAPPLDRAGRLLDCERRATSASPRRDGGAASPTGRTPSLHAGRTSPSAAPSRWRICGYRFPEFPVAARRDPDELGCATVTGARRARALRLTRRRRAHRAQLDHELRGDREARSRRLLPDRPGHRAFRAAAAASWRRAAARPPTAPCCYALGITAVDPVAHGACSSSASSRRSAASGPTSISTCPSGDAAGAGRSSTSIAKLRRTRAPA